MYRCIRDFLSSHGALRSAVLFVIVGTAESFIALPSSAQPFEVTGPGWPVAPNVIKNASVINLFMSDQWDSAAPSGETKERINSWTQALIASPYFAFASNDYGIGTPTFVGGFENSATCIIPGENTTLSTTDLGSYVNCQLTSAPVTGLHVQNVLVNVFIPPGITVTDPTGGTCGVDFSGYHSANQDFSTFLQPYTVIPARCNFEFKDLTNSLSHEMVEAMTDPIGLQGWVHRFGPGDINISESLTKGEVADVCQSGDKPVRNDAIPFFGSGTVQLYWSNSAQACVPSWPGSNPTINPPLPSASVLEHQNNVSLIISGSGFGNPPALPSGLGAIPYFVLNDTTESFSAGNSLGLSDNVLLGYPDWTDTTIEIQIPIEIPMPNQTPLGTVFSCDALSYTIWNPLTLGSAIGSASLPGPASIGIGGYQAGAWVYGSVTVTSDPSTGALYTPTKVTLTPDQGSPQHLAVSYPGNYTFSFQAVGAGPQTLTVSADPPCSAPSQTVTVPVVPTVSSISPDHGFSSGGTVVKIKGTGFSNPATVLFGAQNAMTVTVVSDTEIDAVTAPASPASVDVSVAVNGVQSRYPPPCPPTQVCSGLTDPPTYFFFQAGVPLLVDSVSCQLDYVTIYAWDGNSNPLANAPITLTPTNLDLVNSIQKLDGKGTGEVTARPEGSTMSLTASLASGGTATIGITPAVNCIPWWKTVGAQNNNYNQFQSCPVCHFVDVPFNGDNVAFYDVVSWGLMSGIGDKFQPTAAVTRAQLMTTFERVAGPRAVVAGERIFGLTSESTIATPQKAVTRLEAARFLEIALQRSDRTTVLVGERPFTRGDLARSLWVYVTRDAKLVPGSRETRKGKGSPRN